MSTTFDHSHLTTDVPETDVDLPTMLRTRPPGQLPPALRDTTPMPEFEIVTLDPSAPADAMTRLAILKAVALYTWAQEWADQAIRLADRLPAPADPDAAADLENLARRFLQNAAMPLEDLMQDLGVDQIWMNGHRLGRDLSGNGDCDATGRFPTALEHRERLDGILRVLVINPEGGPTEEEAEAAPEDNSQS